MYYLLHNIGDKKNRNYNTREEVEEASKHGCLTFDGVYRNVWENRDILKGKRFLLFVMGNYVGKDNSFDYKMPLEQLCDWNQIMDLVSIGGELCWHTWSHKDSTKLSDEELEKEVKPLIPMESFAYPYGRFDTRIVEAVRKAGYKYAFGVKEGDGSPYQIKRTYI